MEKFDFRAIKTFADACSHLNIDIDKFNKKYDGMPGHIKALASLEIITKALNNGWVNPLDGETTVYYPWFFVVSKKQEKQSWFADIRDSRKFSYVRPDGTAGLGSARSSYGWSYSDSAIGSRLACKSPSIAKYCAETFCNLWAAYLYPQAEEEYNDNAW